MKVTISYIKWLRNLEIELIEKEILNVYLAQYDLLVDKIERYEENGSKLRCFKDVDTFSAMIIQVETSDFNCFPNVKACVFLLAVHASNNQVVKSVIQLHY